MKVVAPREERKERRGRGEARKDAPHEQWTETRVGDLCRLVNGSAFKPSDWSTEGVPIIRIQNLNDADKPYNYWAGDVDDCVRVRRGDILLAWSGTPGTSFGAHIWDGDDGVLNQHIFRVDLTSDEVTPAWFVWAVNFRLENLIGRAHGAVGLAHVTKGEVQALEIPLPPLAEQERIAGRLTEQLGAVERARAAAAQRLAAAEALPAALLREVFDGPQASGWETLALGELVRTPLRTGISKPGRPDSDKRCLTLSAVRGHTLLLDASKPAEVSDADAEGAWLRPGCFYVVRGNGNRELVGRGAFAPNPMPRPVLFPDLLFQIDLGERVDPSFFWCLWTSATVRREIEERARTAAGIYKINTGNLNTLPLRLPDLPTQRRLAADLGEKLAAAEGVIARCREELAAIEALPASLLRDAFGGGRDGEEPEGA